MNKGHLVEQVASELGATKVAANRAIDAVIRSISQGLRENDAVTIAGFGTFTKKSRQPRTGRNPATGERLEIKASKTVSFRPSPSLKDRLRS